MATTLCRRATTRSHYREAAHESIFQTLRGHPSFPVHQLRPPPVGGGRQHDPDPSREGLAPLVRRGHPRGKRLARQHRPAHGPLRESHFLPLCARHGVAQLLQRDADGFPHEKARSGGPPRGRREGRPLAGDPRRCQNRDPHHTIPRSKGGRHPPVRVCDEALSQILDRVHTQRSHGTHRISGVFPCCSRCARCTAKRPVESIPHCADIFSPARGSFAGGRRGGGDPRSCGSG